MSVLTPYYRTTVAIPATRCVEEPDSNYTPYQVFVLLSRLQYLHPEHDIQPISIPRDNRMVLTLKLFVKNEEVKLSPEEQQTYDAQVSQVLNEDPDHCFFLSGRGPFPRAYPVNWTMAILPYLDLPSEYEPLIREGVIYLNLREVSDFRAVYDELFLRTLNRIQELYEAGAFVTDAPFARRWGLLPFHLRGYNEPFDLEEYLSGGNVNAIQRRMLSTGFTLEADRRTGLYVPVWVNSNLAQDRVSFLYDRAAGRPLQFSVGDNLVVRYYIAQALPQVVFGGSWAFIYDVPAIEEALAWASVLTEARRRATGQVVTIPLADLDKVEALRARAQALVPMTVPVTYRNQDRRYPYTFAFPIPLTMDPHALTVQLQQS